MTSLVFWGTSNPSKAVSYIDSLFLVTSAMTEAGLNTVNLSQLNTFQQVVLFVLIIIGSAIWVSIATVHVRKRAFEQKLQELANNRGKMRRLSRSLHFSLSRTKGKILGQREEAIASGAVRGTAVVESDGRLKEASPDPERHITFTPLDRQEAVDEHDMLYEPKGLSHSPTQPHNLPLSLDGHPNADKDFITGYRDDRHDARPTPAMVSSTLPVNEQALGTPHSTKREGDLNSTTPAFRRSHTRIFSGYGVGARPALNSHPQNAVPRVQQFSSAENEEKALSKRSESSAILDKYLKSFNGFVGRNSQFHGLSEKERRELGGLEYDALALLSYLVPAYFFTFQLLGAIGVGAWIQVNRPGVALQNGLNPFWTGSFFAIVSEHEHSWRQLLTSFQSAFNNSGMVG